MQSPTRDDDLILFAEHGAPPLPDTRAAAYAEHGGARIPPVILLHGGMGHSGNWGYQVPPLVNAGYRVVVIDSRGDGRSTRDTRPYSYGMMASDVLAVMDALRLPRAAFVGWSDGACIALVLAGAAPTRAAGVFFFGCNMDPSGTKVLDSNPVLDRCFARHIKDFAELSVTPGDFETVSAAVEEMQRTQPNWSPADLSAVQVPVTIAHAEHDEFIKQDHAEYLARSIPGAELVMLRGVSHFAPLQRPEEFTATVQRFLGRLQLSPEARRP